MFWDLIAPFAKGLTNEAADDFMTKLMKDKYTDNLTVILSALQKMTLLNTLELKMRASQGEVIERPLGTHLRLSPWEKLLLNPVQLYRFPTPDSTAIDMGVTIGPLAPRPVHLDIPILIAGMSFGSALTRQAKVALARAATIMGTATNSGEGGLLPEERQAATRFIGQYNRGGFMNTPDRYGQLDALEIPLGWGARGAAPRRTPAGFIGEDMRKVYGLEEGQDAVLHSRVPGIDSAQDFIHTVHTLKEETKVPVGVKLAASHFLERDLDVALAAGVDFISLDGAEGGSHGGEPTLADDLGLPTAFAIPRAHRYLMSRGKRDDLSLLAGGGLITPGHFLKALALGADAVYTGTAALIALVGAQLMKVAPWEPPTQLVLYNGKLVDRFDEEEGVQSLVNFLKVSVKEMEAALYALGKTAVTRLEPDDLCCLDPLLARTLGVAYAGVAPEEQDRFFHDLPLAQSTAERPVPHHELH
ncbi:glutamate synthase [Clostridiales bacterium PH28_bin88]|nr:glutamate synthase [Clostridiales bacterium PH28_bin88]